MHVFWSTLKVISNVQIFQEQGACTLYDYTRLTNVGGLCIADKSVVTECYLFHKKTISLLSLKLVCGEADFAA